MQEPALNSILRIILRTSSTQEFFAADYVFKCFCEVIYDFNFLHFSSQNKLWIFIHTHTYTYIFFTFRFQILHVNTLVNVLSKTEKF